MMCVVMMKMKNCKIHPTTTYDHASHEKQVSELIRQAFDELAVLHMQLKPFDNVYDEDFLDCKYEQRRLISDDIEVLRATKLDMERLHAFEDLLQKIDHDIEMLTVIRMVEYSKWKVQYMSVCNKIQEVKNKISGLLQLERNMIGV